MPVLPEGVGLSGSVPVGKCIEMRVGSGVGAAVLLADQRLNAPLSSAAAANSPPLSPGRRLGLLMPP